MVNRSNIAVLSDKTSTVDIDDKLNRSFWEQEFMQRGRDSLWKNMEQGNENLGSTDKDWKSWQ